MEHKCRRKKGLIQECLVDRAGYIYCKSCNSILDDSQVHPAVLSKINNTMRRR